MLSCMMPVEANINLYKQPIRCFQIEDITIYSSLKKTEIERIILSLLSQNCGMNVIGYNKDTNEYWCKNVKNNTTNSYYKLILFGYDFNITTIKIEPLIGTKQRIKKFELALKSAIFDYEFEVQ